MLTEKQLSRYADVLIWGLKTARRGRIKKKEIVLIRYDRPAIQLTELLYARILSMGLYPIQRLMPTPAMDTSFYQNSDKWQLTFIPPGEAELYQQLSGSIVVMAPESITHLKHIDPGIIARPIKARKPLRDIIDRREEEGLFSWTLGIYPTQELADQAGIPLSEYANQIVRACFLNRTAPVTQWESIYKKAQSIKKWLNGMPIRHLRIETSNMDLEITPGEKRRWIGISGHNIPSFEIFISPDWRGTRGNYYADQPSFRSGNRISGIRVEFHRGKAVSASAEEGEPFLKRQLAIDAGACRIGEFSLTDKTFSKINRFMANTLFDENFGGKNGNCHVAFGSSYSDTYDGNPSELDRQKKQSLGFNDSALHWDIVNTEKKCVTAHLSNGRKTVIYENGRFTC